MLFAKAGKKDRNKQNIMYCTYQKSMYYRQLARIIAASAIFGKRPGSRPTNMADDTVDSE
jgi:hypothetical protein